MKYLGSGPLGKLISQLDSDLEATHFLVIGRRIRNFKLNDWGSIRRSRCIFLDTVDLDSISTASFLVKLRWWLDPYRVEKSITYYVFKIFSPQVIRIHVPAILDSVAWERLALNDGGILISGFTYRDIAKLLSYSTKNPKGVYRCSDLYSLCEELGIEVESARVKDCFSSRIVNYANKT